MAFIIAALVVTGLVTAAPIENISPSPASDADSVHPSFVSSPRGRGTLDIFFTCIITLTLCVWTAIHPNIIPNPTVTRCLRHKALYVIIGLVLPEIVLGIAINEWRQARRVLTVWKRSVAVESARRAAGKAKRALERRDEEPRDMEEKEARNILIKEMKRANQVEEIEDALKAAPDVRDAIDYYRSVGRVLDARKKGKMRGLVRRAWEAVVRGRKRLRRMLLLCSSGKDELGMEGAFFAVMGGYKFCPLDPYQNPDYELTLSVEGIIFLLERDILKGFELAKLRNEVRDKGKADWMAKILVCGQVTWMTVNCFFRKAAGLPITIIELNVIVHVACAVVVYACWWKKPHDAGSAISLNTVTLKEPICALLYVIDSSLKMGLTLHASVTPRGAEPDSTLLGDIPICGEEERQQSPFPDMETSGLLSDSKSIKHRASIRKKLPDPPRPSPLGDIEVLHKCADEIQRVKFSDRYKKSFEEGQPPILYRDDILIDKGRGVILKVSAPSIALTVRDYVILASAANALRECTSHGILSICNDLSNYPLQPKEIPCMTATTNIFNISGLEMMWIPLYLIYGGIHATLWNTYFPSPMERNLWRISCIIIGIPGLGAWAIKLTEAFINPNAAVRSITGWSPKALPRRAANHSAAKLPGFLVSLLLVVIACGSVYGGIELYTLVSRSSMMIHYKTLLHMLIAGGGAIIVLGVMWIYGEYYFEWFNPDSPQFMSTLLMGVFSNILLFLVVVSTLVYSLARLFIFIETFICLRSLPFGAYDTVVWEEFLPHL